MNKRTLVEFITAWLLVLLGAVMTLLPLFKVVNIRTVFILIISSYGVIHLFKNLFILNFKDFTGFGTSISCVVALALMFFLDVYDSPWNLALILFIWIILMSLNKLKESDYYHDRKNKLWLLNIVNLILFIISGLLTSINLYYTSDIQILILGFFFLIHGILELMDPLAAYLIAQK